MTTKPAIDWPYIRMRYESGDGSAVIARETGMCSKQAISQRALKENWVRPERVRNDGKALTTIFKALSVNGSKFTEETVGVLVDMIAKGAPEYLAAQAAGISADTMTRWKTEDPKFAELLRRTRAGKLSDWIGRIDCASLNDWKAADRLLQTSPETKALFGNTSPQGNRLEVVLNFSRGDAPVGVTIDQEPAQVTQQDEQHTPETQNPRG